MPTNPERDEPADETMIAPHSRNSKRRNSDQSKSRIAPHMKLIKEKQWTMESREARTGRKAVGLIQKEGREADKQKFNI